MVVSGSADTEVEVEPDLVQAWREAQMFDACGDIEVALELLAASVDYHDVERARAGGCPVALLVAVFA